MLIAYGWFCRDGISRSGKLGRLSQKHLSFNGSACFVEISLQCSIWIAKIPFRNMMMLAVSFHFHHHLNLNLLPQPKFGFHPDPIRELRSWLIIRLALSTATEEGNEIDRVAHFTSTGLRKVWCMAVIAVTSKKSFREINWKSGQTC